MSVDAPREFPLLSISITQLFPSHLELPRPTLSQYQHVIVTIGCTIGALNMTIAAGRTLRMRSRFSRPSCTSSFLDGTVATFSGFKLQVCLIITLSFCCSRWRLGFVRGQVSLACRIAIQMHSWAVDATACLVREVARRQHRQQLLELL